MHSIEFLLGLLILISALVPRSTAATEIRHASFDDSEPYAVSGGSLSRALSNGPGSQLSKHPSRSSATCPSDYSQCGNEFPSNFCCPTAGSCVSLAENTTVLCCPDGEDCSSIEPISCNIDDYNASTTPLSPVHTTNLTGQLPTCGSQCCPFGYSCSRAALCVMDADNTDGLATSTSTSSTGTAATPSATGNGLVTDNTPGSSTTVAVSSGSTPTAIADSNDGSPSASTKGRTIGIATGSAVAGLAGIVAILICAWLRKRRAMQTVGELPVSTGEMSRPTPKMYQAGRPRPVASTPPPLPRKNTGRSPKTPKTKRKSLLSWVPSVVNRTPAELPATPVSFSHWGQLEPGRRSEIHRPYPRSSLGEDEVHELEARWLPQERYI